MKTIKYGFVYIWRDKRYNRYYVGCHWGTINDGYICSSRWMKQAYKNRPCDFKRKIIQTVENKKDLFDAEYEWLKLIKTEELGKKYYNLRTSKWEHWSQNQDISKTVGQKIAASHQEYEKRHGKKWGHWQVGRVVSDEQRKHLSVLNKGKEVNEATKIKLKKLWECPEYREKQRIQKTGRKQSPEAIAKRVEASKKTKKEHKNSIQIQFGSTMEHLLKGFLKTL